MATDPPMFRRTGIQFAVVCSICGALVYDIDALVPAKARHEEFHLGGSTDGR